MKLCEVCKKNKPKDRFTCSSFCRDLMQSYGYYDIDGELKLTERGIEKLYEKENK